MTRTYKSGRETVATIQDRFKRGRFVHAANDAEEAFFEKASEDVTENYIAVSGARVVSGSSTVNSQDTAIFVVHGHGRKDEVARFLAKVTKREPIVLGEKPGRGRTIIEKFEDEASGAAYAVVLLTADDVGRSKTESDDQLRSRARQNAILELGYFIGKIGRENVAVLYEDVELPSDYTGVEYISFADNWQMRLARELGSAGFDVDLAR